MTRFFCSSWTAWRFCDTFTSTSCLGRLSRGHRVEARCFTHQQAVAVNIRKTSLLLLDLHKQAKGKAWETVLGNKLSSVPHRRVFVAKFSPNHRTWLPPATPEQNWIKGPPMCPLCEDAEEIDDHIQRYHSVWHATDNSNKDGCGNY